MYAHSLIPNSNILRSSLQLFQVRQEDASRRLSSQPYCDNLVRKSSMFIMILHGHSGSSLTLHFSLTNWKLFLKPVGFREENKSLFPCPFPKR